MHQKRESNKLDPKIDIVFKGIFGKKGNEYILDDLLSAILNKKVKCTEVESEVSLSDDLFDEKCGILDIKAILESKEEVDIEMQIANRYDTINRAVFYASKLTTMGLKKSESYLSMKKKIVIFILNYTLFEYDEALQESYITLKSHIEKELTDLHKYYFIELPKVQKLSEIGSKRLKMWIAFLNQDKEMLLNMAKGDKIIKKAEEELEYLSGDAKLRRIAELKEKALRDEATMKIVGMREGLEKGIEKGLKRGRKQNQYDTAKKLIKENMDNEFIARITELNLEEINKLRNELECK